MTLALAGFLFSGACYGVAVGYAIRFDARHDVSIAAALAPAVVWLGLHLDPLAASPWVMFGPAIAVITLLARKRSFQVVAVHVALFGATLGLAVIAAAAHFDEPLIVGLVSCTAYLLIDGWRQRLSERSRIGVAAGDRRTYWLLHAVLLCACGLTILGVQKMDWPAFAAMAMVLALTKREFEAFAQSRDTYEQTVAALSELRTRSTVPGDRQ